MGFNWVGLGSEASHRNSQPLQSYLSQAGRKLQHEKITLTPLTSSQHYYTSQTLLLPQARHSCLTAHSHKEKHERKMKGRNKKMWGQLTLKRWLDHVSIVYASQQWNYSSAVLATLVVWASGTRTNPKIPGVSVGQCTSVNTRSRPR